MNYDLSRLIVTLTVGIALSAHAKLQLPEASPHAVVSQEIGLTTVTVDYHRPALRGRAVWGKLVPFDKVWRTGANEATTIAFSRGVTFAGKAVPAGKYALFTIPRKSGAWTVIVSRKATQWGAYKYDPSTDVARVELKPGKSKATQEWMSFRFSGATPASAVLELAWDKLTLQLPIAVDTVSHAADNIAAQASSWREHLAGAEYLIEHERWDIALKQADACIAKGETWYAVWLRAQALAGKGDASGAVTAAQRAQELGARASNFSGQDKKAVSDLLSRLRK